jgi:hypothetical protein
MDRSDPAFPARVRLDGRLVPVVQAVRAPADSSVPAAIGAVVVTMVDTPTVVATMVCVRRRGQDQREDGQEEEQAPHLTLVTTHRSSASPR